MKNKFLKYSIAVIISLCCVCVAGALGITIFSGSILSTPTPQALLPQNNFSIIIAQTASVAQTQTMLAMPPAPLATVTLAPSAETIPTATIFIFDLQTQVAQPTDFVYSTNTPFSLATQPLQTIQATLPPQSAVCSCSGNTLNCSDFSSHAAAQACFNYCISQGAGDIHRLDGNNDGSACESLP